MPTSGGTSDKQDGAFPLLHDPRYSLIYQEIPQEIQKDNRTRRRDFGDISAFSAQKGLWRNLGIHRGLRHCLLVLWHLSSVLGLFLTLSLASLGLGPLVLASAQELSKAYRPVMDEVSGLSIESVGKTTTGSSRTHSHSRESGAYSPPFRLASASYDAWIRVLNRRSAEDAQKRLNDQCLVLNNETVKHLCRQDPWKRLESFRRTLVLPNVTEKSGVLIYGLFLLTRVEWETEADLKTGSNLAHLREGVHARDCVAAEAETQRCTDCMMRLLRKTEEVGLAFSFFHSSLSQFDCNLENITQRFSANSTCDDCLAWYQRWLLLSVMGSGGEGVWSLPPCPDWCEEAELSCPHLSSIKEYDYAGMPSFRCTDPNIVRTAPGANYPHCVRTCDFGNGSYVQNDSFHCRKSWTSKYPPKTGPPPEPPTQSPSSTNQPSKKTADTNRTVTVPLLMTCWIFLIAWPMGAYGLR